MEAKCIGCGCTDSRACLDAFDQPCGWLIVDYKSGTGVCSQCPDKVDDYKKRKTKAASGVAP